MLSFKFSKSRPLQIKDTLTNEIIELIVPQEYKNMSMTINLKMSKRFQLIRKSADADSKAKEVSDENKFNK
jgi:hypothetical protein